MQQANTNRTVHQPTSAAPRPSCVGIRRTERQACRHRAFRNRAPPPAATASAPEQTGPERLKTSTNAPHALARTCAALAGAKNARPAAARTLPPAAGASLRTALCTVASIPNAANEVD